MFPIALSSRSSSAIACASLAKFALISTLRASAKHFIRSMHCSIALPMSTRSSSLIFRSSSRLSRRERHKMLSTRRDIRSLSSMMVWAACCGGSNTPCSMPCAYPPIDIRGLRSSCDTFWKKRCCVCSAAWSFCDISFMEQRISSSSARKNSGSIETKSPSPMRRAPQRRCLSGFVTLRAVVTSTIKTKNAKIDETLNTMIEAWSTQSPTIDVGQ